MTKEETEDPMNSNCSLLDNPSNANRLLSIVIPVYQEAENLVPLHERLRRVLASIPMRTEILFVDDGSVDSSAEIIKELGQTDPSVKLLSFSRNFGHQIAVTAGLDYCRGDAVIVMDADMQHPPELIPTLLEQWKAGYDVVYTIRQDTADASFSKRLTSWLFYEVLAFLSSVKVPHGSADFRLMDRRAVEALRLLREKDRFVRGLVPWIGFKQVGVPYVAPERHAGRTKYTFFKMLQFAMNGVASLSYFPLRLSFFMGLSISFLGFLYALYALAVFVKGEAVTGWTSLLVVILLLGGVQLTMLGLVGEYIGRIYNEVKDRPLYIIGETYGLDDRLRV
jgi:polyisoprenyl-phosphate glycosyltransferase